MLKKTILVLSLVFVPFSASAFFTDVDERDLNYNAILELYQNEVVKGYEDGTFKPSKKVTRAEALKIILEGSEVEISDIIGSKFIDVDSEDWFAPYVYTALDSGIVKGYDDSTFRPNNEISLVEALKILTEVNGVNLESVNEGEKIFEDVYGSVWYADLAKFAKEGNIVDVSDLGLFNAGEDLSRASLAELMFRFRHLVNSKFDRSLNFEIYESAGMKINAPKNWEYSGTDIGFQLVKEDSIYNVISSDVFTPNKVVISGFRSGSDYQDLDELEIDYKEAYEKSGLEFSFSSGSEGISFVGSDFVDKYFLFEGSIYGLSVRWGENSVIGYQISDYIENIIRSFEITGSGISTVTSIDELLSESRENILIKGVAESTLQTFSEYLIIDTDTIGLGNGPVDYYYVPDADHTFKVDRTWDAILDIREGRTSDF